MPVPLPQPVSTLMRLLFVAAAWACLTACGSPAGLAHTYDSPEEVATAVLEGYRARDREALERLALSESEFRRHVWPELPAARPERNLPFSYVWGDLQQKSAQSLQGLLARYGGQAYTLVSVTFADRTPYQTYTVHRESTFVVRTADGAQQTVRLCGSMIEQGGRWKVFSHVVDD